ncbi:MAG: hypothetical protein WDN08_00215 [Rhizomicrobium sp.]
MREKAAIAEAPHPEPTLAEELALLGDDGVVETANLTAGHTGIEGIVFI